MAGPWTLELGALRANMGKSGRQPDIAWGPDDQLTRKCTTMGACLATCLFRVGTLDTAGKQFIRDVYQRAP